MNQLRLDPLSGRWVAVSTDRIERGPAFSPREPAVLDPDAPCPFCPGNEDATPPALETYGAEGHWLVRVVPNRYPAFEGLQPFVVEHRGPVFTQAPASGIHEVLIFSPDHHLSLGSLDDHQTELVMMAIRDRVEEHQGTPGLRYSQVIVNYGREAGASQDHPHGQLLGIPFVPRELVDEQGSFSRFAGGCLLCTALASEERAGYRLVEGGEHAVTFAPYWSGTPYELLVVPRNHEAHLHRTPPTDLASVGLAVRNALASLRLVLGDIAYNVVFHSAPYRASAPYHWHVHVLPKLTTRAGFELGTGVYINVVAPERVAEELRDAIASSRPLAVEGHSSEGVAS
ncbi:MAG: galactose-phosphate uridylyltransferase [Acidimicrobiaceae bacterium]|nr:galactose-phosphate uridylyltransferase [Acidimicrobiaceae bacterium]